MFSPRSACTSSSTGCSIRQGPHQGAQKSTSTGCSALSTSASNVPSVTTGSPDTVHVLLGFRIETYYHNDSIDSANSSARRGQWQGRRYTTLCVRSAKDRKKHSQATICCRRNGVRVAIDGQFLSMPPSGTGTYLRNLIDALPVAAPDIAINVVDSAD